MALLRGELATEKPSPSLLFVRDKDTVSYAEIRRMTSERGGTIQRQHELCGSDRLASSSVVN